MPTETDIAKDVDGRQLKNLSSGTNGVFFNGKLQVGTYYLEETKAPTGYNKLDGRSALHATAGTAPADNIDAKIENNKGGVLPSTGGIGTTIFYVIGAILVLAAGVLLVARRRTRDE